MPKLKVTHVAQRVMVVDLSSYPGMSIDEAIEYEENMAEPEIFETFGEDAELISIDVEVIDE